MGCATFKSLFWNTNDSIAKLTNFQRRFFLTHTLLLKTYDNIKVDFFYGRPDTDFRFKT